MDGERCLGLVFDESGNWEQFIVSFTIWAYVAGEAYPEAVRKVIRRAATDTMGRTGVIVYWPYGGLTLTD